MPNINVPDIQNLDDATPELWNSRYATIVNLLNGNLDADNIASGGITASELASNSVTTAKLADDAITAAKLDWATTGANGGIWWEEIARQSLGSTSDVFTMSSIPARKYLKIYFTLIHSGAVTMKYTFNNDTGTNYAFRYMASGTTGSNVSGTSVGVWSGTNHVSFGEMTLVNLATSPKVGKLSVTGGDTTGANTAEYVDFWFKWTNATTQINRIDFTNTAAGDLLAASEIVVLGHD